MKLLTNKKIAIVGAGPGGLTLARILQLQGADVQVYERDINKDARMQGATLDLHEESGLRAIREAGLMEAFMANYRPGADKMRIVDKCARIVLDDAEKGYEDHSRPEIDRGPLQTILLDSLQPGTVVWDRHFVALSPEREGWKLRFKNDVTVYADLVIAADGANSKIRPTLTPIKPFYAGVTCIEGAVYHSETAAPKIHALLNGGKIFALGDEKSLIVSSKGDGSLVFYTGCKTAESWSRDSGIDFADKTQVLAWFQQTYTGWDPVWQELFENASTPFVPRPQYSMPSDQTWEALPNLTMLGDAAHLMPPFAGEGVNMAMLDALELGLCLGSERSSMLQAAIASFETQMRVRASATARETLVATEGLHSTEAMAFMIGVVS